MKSTIPSAILDERPGGGAQTCATQRTLPTRLLHLAIEVENEVERVTIAQTVVALVEDQQRHRAQIEPSVSNEVEQHLSGEHQHLKHKQHYCIRNINGAFFTYYRGNLLPAFYRGNLLPAA